MLLGNKHQYKYLFTNVILIVKSPLLLKNVFLLVPTVGCLSFTQQKDVCGEFDTRMLFLHSSAELKVSLCSMKIGF